MTYIVIVVFSVKIKKLEGFLSYFKRKKGFDIIIVDNSIDGRYENLKSKINYTKGSNINLDLGGYLEGFSLCSQNAKNYVFMNDIVFHKHLNVLIKWYLLFKTRDNNHNKAIGLLERQFNVPYLNTSLLIFGEDVIKHFTKKHNRIQIKKYASVYRKFGFISNNWRVTGTASNNHLTYKKIRMVSLEKYLSLVMLKPYKIKRSIPLHISRFLAKIINYVTKGITI